MKIKALQSVLKFWQEIFFVISMGFGLTVFAKEVILGYTMDGWDIFLVCWFVPLLICLVGQFFWKSEGLAIFLSVLLGLSSFVVILMGLYGVSTNGVTLYLIQSNIMLIWGIIGFIAAISMTVDFKLRPTQIRDFKKKQIIWVLAAIIVITGIGYGNRARLYYHSGKSKRTDCLGIVDKNSGDLWVYMKYKELIQ